MTSPSREVGAAPAGGPLAAPSPVPPAAAPARARAARRRALWSLVLAGVLAGAVLGVGAAAAIRIPVVSEWLGIASAAPFNGGVLTPPLDLPEVTLQRADGRTFAAADTRGRISLFFFGYTNCPDVCPTTALEMRQVREELGARAKDVDMYFVTVDPDRDTPERLKAYLALFDPSLVGLTGTSDELQRLMDGLGVVAARRDVPESKQIYYMDHTAAVYLVDREGKARLIYPFGMEAEQLTADIKRLLR